MAKIALGEIKPSTVLHIISGDAWAGAEAQFVNTISSLSETNEYHHICIVFNSGILKSKLEQLRVQTILIDEVISGNFTLMIKLCKAIHAIMPDVIHVHRVKEHVMSFMCNVVARKNVHLVRTIHSSSALPRKSSLKQLMKSSVAIMIDRFAVKYLADALIFVSKDLQEGFRDLKGRARSHQIYNSINPRDYIGDINRETIRNRYGANNRFWIGTAARLVDIKNLPMLIKAGAYLAERHIPFKISIFGEGPLKYELQELIFHMNLAEQVELHGFELEIVPILKSLDVFVLCSFHEGIPISLLEAMASGTPAVCSRVGGMVEIIDHGVNGLLVPANDSNKLAEALMRLYDDDKFAKTLTQNALMIFEGKLSSATTARQLCSVYGQLVSN